MCARRPPNPSDGNWNDMMADRPADVDVLALQQVDPVTRKDCSILQFDTWIGVSTVRSSVLVDLRAESGLGTKIRRFIGTSKRLLPPVSPLSGLLSPHQAAHRLRQRRYGGSTYALCTLLQSYSGASRSDRASDPGGIMRFRRGGRESHAVSYEGLVVWLF